MIHSAAGECGRDYSVRAVESYHSACGPPNNGMLRQALGVGGARTWRRQA
jgi:hypothetical protein